MGWWIVKKLPNIQYAGMMAAGDGEMQEVVAA